MFASGSGNDELNGVDHCSYTTGNGFEFNCLGGCCVNSDSIICTVIGSFGNCICYTVYTNLCGVGFVFCYINDNLRYIFRNGECEGTCLAGSAELDTRITHCIISRTVNVGDARKGESIGTGSIRFAIAEGVSVNVSCRTVCTQIKDDGFGLACFEFVTAVGAEAVVVIVTESFKGFFLGAQFADRANILDVTVFGAGFILAVCYYIVMGASDYFIKTTVLHLRGSVVVADNTVYGNFVTETGLGCHCIITSVAVIGIDTVDVELVACFILDIYVAVRGVNDLYDDTGYVVLVGGISVFRIRYTQSICLCKCECFAVCGSDNAGTIVALVICFITCVAGSSYFFLCYENFVTCRAVLTFGKTGFFALGSDCSINNFGVTGSSYFFLCNKNLVTNGAVLTFGKTGFFALRSNSSVNYFGVTGSSYFFLFHENFVTNGAVLTFGKTGFFTIGSNCSVNYFGVTESFSGIGCIGFTASAGVSCITILGASGSSYNSIITVYVVRLGYDCFFNVTTSRTYSVLCTFCLFGSGSINDPLAIGVTVSGYFFLFYENFVTNGAVLTFGKTGFFALGSNSSVDNFGVTGCSYLFLFYENFVTNGAVLTFGKTGFFTLGSNSCVNNLGVTFGGDNFAFANDFTTIHANGVASVTVGDTVSCDSILNSGVGVFTFRRLCQGINSDAINSNLTVREYEIESVNCYRECDDYILAVNSCVSTGACKRFGARCCVSSGVTYDNDLGHAGMGDGYRGCFIETHGFCVISNIAGGLVLEIGNGNAIHYPNLFLRVEFSAVCFIIKVNRYFCYFSFGSATYCASTVYILVICRKNLCDCVSALRANIFDVTRFGTGCFLFGLYKAMLTNNVFGNPTVLHLRSIAVLANDTVNGNCVTCNRLGCQILVRCFAICTVGAVNGEYVSERIGNIHVTVLIVVNLSDDTGYIVLTRGIGIVLLSLTQSDCFLNGEGGTNFGRCYLRGGFLGSRSGFLGSRSGFLGSRSGNFGLGSGNFGLGSGNFGSRSSYFGSGSSYFGSGSSNFGFGSGSCNFRSIGCYFGSGSCNFRSIGCYFGSRSCCFRRNSCHIGSGSCYVGSVLIPEISCGFLIGGSFGRILVLNSFARCHVHQKHHRQGQYNEDFEHSFHFSPSRK